MKRYFPIFLFLFIVVFSALNPAFAHAYQVEPPVAETSPISLFLTALQTAWDSLKGMVYISVLGAMLLNLLKQKGYVQDGQAQIAMTVIGSVTVLILGIIKFAYPDMDLMVFDHYASLIVDTNGAFTPVALLLINLISKLFHKQVLVGLPSIGFSYTNRWNTPAKMIVPEKKTKK